jgi:hypothetical protein
VTGDSLPHLLILRQTCSDKDFLIFGQLSGQVKRIPAFAAPAPVTNVISFITYTILINFHAKFRL